MFINYWDNLLILPFSYLLGSISSAIILSRHLNLPDPRKIGSKNAGTTNMLRIAGKKVAILILIIDFMKGFIPVLIAKYFLADILWQTIIGLLAVLGHIYPIFFNFRGGKGVATFLGALIAISPIVGIISIITWLIIAKVFKISSIAGLISIILSPIYFWLYLNKLDATIAISTIVLLVVFKHKSNIKKLLAKQEKKII